MRGLKQCNCALACKSGDLEREVGQPKWCKRGFAKPEAGGLKRCKHGAVLAKLGEVGRFKRCNCEVMRKEQEEAI